MKRTVYYSNGQKANEADDVASTYSAWERDGTVIEQRALAQSEITDLAAWVTEQNRAANAQTLRDRASAAITANNSFLALASPTNAQTLAQVQRLTKECSTLIMLMLGRLDDINGT